MYNKSDYIPCIAWGRNAAYAESLDVGTKLMLEGRLQSREYKKKLDDGAPRCARRLRSPSSNWKKRRGADPPRLLCEIASAGHFASCGAICFVIKYFYYASSLSTDGCRHEQTGK